MVGAWAFYLYPDLLPKGRVNYGKLIEPSYPLGDLTLSTPAGSEFRIEDTQGKWSLFWLTSRRCGGDECASTLLRLRNLRLALREDGERLQSYAIPLTSSRGDWLRQASKFSNTVVFTGSDEALRDLVARIAAGANLDPLRVDGFYLVDPSGNLMMRYNADADFQGVLSDLQRLLKYTWAGR